MTSLDGINGPSIQTLLRGENDSKQSDEFQAIYYQDIAIILKKTSPENFDLKTKGTVEFSNEITDNFPSNSFEWKGKASENFETTNVPLRHPNR